MNNKISPLISVIVPIFNMEKHLEECLESIINQESNDFEVILINDGSNDNSESICNYYLSKDKRFILINKKNGGVSSARNAGLKLAKGKFILFVDADDIISKDYLTIDKEFYDCDIIEKSSVHIKSSNNKVVRHHYKNRSVVISDNEQILKHYTSNKNNALWDKFISKDIIGNRLFDESLKIGEDLIFSIGLALKIRNYGISAKGRYYYRIHDSSVMKTTICHSSQYINNLFNLTSKIYSNTSSSYIANGLTARYNIPKLFGQRKKLNDNQRKELGRLFKLIKYSDLCYLDFKHKVKYLIKKLHYNLFF